MIILWKNLKKNQLKTLYQQYENWLSCLIIKLIHKIIIFPLYRLGNIMEENNSPKITMDKFKYVE